MEFDQKIALVLGAARGIGKAYCDSLLQRGARVSKWHCKQNAFLFSTSTVAVCMTLVIKHFSRYIRFIFQVAFCDMLSEEGRQTEAEFQERYGTDRATFHHCDCSKFEQVEGQLFVAQPAVMVS